MDTPQGTDRRVARIHARGEETRQNRAAQVEYEHKQRMLDLQAQAERQRLKQQKRQDRDAVAKARRDKRQQARAALGKQVHDLMPTVGRRVMIAGPILAPMVVAWVGQISFAQNTLGWDIVGALVFAAAWELTTAFSGWMYHQARKDGDRGTLFRIATWVFAASAGAMNYWHACAVVKTWTPAGGFKTTIDLTPTPKAISYGAMSLAGIALWELYSSLIHRKHLRAEGVVSSARPRFGILRWLRFTRITWHAWSLAVRYGIRTVDEAWRLAVAEIDRRKAAKDNRSNVRVTVVRELTAKYTNSRSRNYWVTDLTGATLTQGHHRGATTREGHYPGEGRDPQGATEGANVPGPRRPLESGATTNGANEGHLVAPRQVEPKVAPMAPPVGPTNVAPANVAPANSGGELIEFAPRGETQTAMRNHWDAQIAEGRIPSGADLNRAVDKDPKYSLGKKYARAWRQELPEQFVKAVEAGRVEEAREIAAGFSAGERKEVAQ